MCTVTAQQTTNGWRVTMNRDERRSRISGEPPFLWESSPILAPRDREAGGTWIGVRADGKWACLLNGYPDTVAIPLSAPTTRGRIIPEILTADDPATALQALNLLNTQAFRLLLGHAEQVTEWAWDQHELTCAALIPGPRGAVFASSSYWQQQEVISYRRNAFKVWQDQGAPTTPFGVPTFHCETLPRGPSWSVCTSRDVAHTKSITQIEILTDDIRMHHWEQGTFDAAPQSSVSMRRERR